MQGNIKNKNKTLYLIFANNNDKQWFFKVVFSAAKLCID
jgi:hypothetical protein